jgi:hypothetical protein
VANSWIFLCLAAISCLAGLTWLALAMEPHWQSVHRERASMRPARLLRILGVVGLFASAVFCFIADRPSMAVLVWVLLLAATAPSVGMILAWRPQLLRVFWP